MLDIVSHLTNSSGTNELRIASRIERLCGNPFVNRLGRRGLALWMRTNPRVERFRLWWRASGEAVVQVGAVSFRMMGRRDDHYFDALAVGKTFERAELLVFEQLAQHSAAVIDIGVHTGVYSLVAACGANRPEVVAIEPHPGNAARLRHNVAVNRAKVTVIEAAAGHTPGYAVLTVPESGELSDVASLASSFTRAFYGLSYHEISVPQTTVDAEVERLCLDRVDLIKIDVETLELAVLRGATSTLRRDKPVVLVEVLNPDVLAGDHPELERALPSDNAEQVMAVLGETGYRAYAVGSRGLLRVARLDGIPDGGCNFVFTAASDLPRYISFRDISALRALSVHPASSDPS